jgi:hypothetical protein
MRMTKSSKLAVIAVFFSLQQIPVEAVSTGPISSGTSSLSSPVVLELIRIERGGTINSIDLKQKTMRVDGDSWSISGASLKNISKPSLLDTPADLSELKPGMLIRFVTVKKNASNPDQVLEISVTHSPLPQSRNSLTIQAKPTSKP